MENNHHKNAFSLLIVDDEKNIQNAIRRYFARCPYQIMVADTGDHAMDIIKNTSISLMLLDLKMPGMNGLEVLKRSLEIHPDLKIILLTGHGGVEEAVSAIKLGAIDFCEKSISPEVLRRKVSQVYEMWQLQTENLKLNHRLQSSFHYAPLIGESPAILKLKDMIVRIAPTQSSVLIQGESGSGKELVARAIHHHSNRNQNIFVPIDCASISETVLESELFGHDKGAFSGADKKTVGLIRAADKGTLFLDEVGELSLNMQAKLLRTIQERTVRPVGSTQMIPVDIRIVAATNRDLVSAITSGEFRQDLYYRFSAVTLFVPPLRDRKDDLEQLSRHILQKLEEEGFAPKDLSLTALKKLHAYHFPGNVRELENIFRSAMAFEVKDTISLDDFASLSFQPSPISEKNQITPSASLSDYEKSAIQDALSQSSGNRRKAAKLLGISEATLYRRLKQYHV